jgi:hypothetical protein
MSPITVELRYVASLIGKPAPEVIASAAPAEALSEPAAIALFQAVISAVSKRSEPTPEDVVAELEERGTTRTVGGAHQVPVLAAMYGHERPAALLPEVLREAERRSLVEASRTLAEAAERGTLGGGSAALIQALQNVQRFSASSGSEPLMDSADHLQDLVARLSDYAEGRKQAPPQADVGPMTPALGWPTPQTLTVIGGFSHSGKSFLMQYLERAYTAAGVGTMRLSLEDGNLVNQARIAAEYAGDGFQVRHPSQQVAKQLLAKLVAGTGDLNTAFRRVPRIVHTPRVRDVGSLLGLMRRGVTERGVQVVFVDYAQEVNVDGADDTRSKVATAVAALKSEAIRLGVQVVLGSQLRKPSTGGKNYEPSPHDLKDASELHHAAEVLILCWREDVKVHGASRVVRLGRIAKDKLTGTGGFFWMQEGEGGVVQRVVPVRRGNGDALEVEERLFDAAE